MRVAGLISGTSADGIDVAVVEIRGAGRRTRLRLEAFRTVSYPARIRQAILAASNARAISTAEISQLNFLVGELFARALLKTCRGRKPDLVGTHGQTIYHQGLPGPCHGFRVSSTFQIGEPAVIAERAGVTTVGDFRTADMAAGGEGAPLVPFLDYLLFRHPRRTRVGLNLGGIANVTVIPAGAGPEDVMAFDTGPGNMVIDALVAHFSRGRSHFDCGGRIAARGAIDVGLFNEWTSHPYFNRRPPKSCGREEFGESFVELGIAARRRALEPADVIATATAVTAHSIAEAYRKFLPQRARKPVVDEIIVCGGGVFNRTLMRELQRRLSTTRVRSIAEFGIAAQAKEGLSFAMLACACVDGVPDNLIAVTGAQRAVVLGQIISP